MCFHNTIACSCSPCSLSEAIQDQKTYVFYVTMVYVIMCNMHGQLLMIQNGIFSLDSFNSVITMFYLKRVASEMIRFL